MLYGGSPSDSQSIQRFLKKFPSTNLNQIWGMTETSVNTCLSLSDHKEGGKLLNSCGRAVKGVSISIRDIENGRDDADYLKSPGRSSHSRRNEHGDNEGEGAKGKEKESEKDVGELIVKSNGSFAGYFMDDTNTHEVLLQNGYVATGDVGYIEDGYVYILDRVKDIVVTASGMNVFTREVRAQLLLSSRIVKVAVLVYIYIVDVYRCIIYITY